MVETWRVSVGAVVLGCVVFTNLVTSAAAADDRPVPTPLERERAEAALIFDVRKLVSSKEDTGWKIDRYEIEELMSDALVSVCEVEPTVRDAALQWTERMVKRRGGPLKSALAAGADPDDLGDLITATRVRDLLREAVRRAPGDCPAWMVPDPEFRGIQSDAHRVTLNLEVGGIAIAQRRNGDNEVGVGGAGRLLLGYGISHHYTLLAGAEFGGVALFKREGDTTQFPLQFTVAAPLVIRHHFLSFHHDLEVAPIVFFTEDNTHPSYGVRVGGTLGVSTIRIRRIMPWAGLGLAFEHFFANEHRGSLGAIRGGARVGFDWDF